MTKARVAEDAPDVIIAEVTKLPVMPAVQTPRGAERTEPAERHGSQAFVLVAGQVLPEMAVPIFAKNCMSYNAPVTGDTDADTDTDPVELFVTAGVAAGVAAAAVTMRPPFSLELHTFSLTLVPVAVGAPAQVEEPTTPVALRSGRCGGGA